MKKIQHWTPRYIKNRILEIIYHRKHPDHPWLTKDANMILNTYLKKSDIGLEFGSGRSTCWFAKKIHKLTSIEHDEQWFKNVNTLLRKNNLNNVDYLLKPIDNNIDNVIYSSYVKIIDRFEINSLDFVLIDGIYRDICAFNALNKIKQGGLLIVDNVNWFLPFKSYSPNSRTEKNGPITPVWEKFYHVVSKWRSIWTSSGVTDTAFFFRPYNNNSM